MPTYAECSEEFLRLTANTCGKCQMLAGKSTLEKAIIHVSFILSGEACLQTDFDSFKKTPQCHACGLIYSELQHSLCKK
jgi:hypothetical protein